MKVVEGDYRTGKMSAAKVSDSDLQAGYALACRLFPAGNLVIAVE
nr:L359 [uncultured bacterium]